MSEDTKKILVVEDNALNLELVTDLLEVSGFQVVSAGNGEDAVSLALLHQPDLVLMDLSLPGIDGLEATRRLKSEPQTDSIPVVAVTAHSMKGDRQRVEAAGCCGYLSKPIDTRSFVQVIKGFLSAP